MLRVALAKAAENNVVENKVAEEPASQPVQEEITKTDTTVVDNKSLYSKNDKDQRHNGR